MRGRIDYVCCEGGDGAKNDSSNGKDPAVGDFLTVCLCKHTCVFVHVWCNT